MYGVVSVMRSLSQSIAAAHLALLFDLYIEEEQGIDTYKEYKRQNPNLYNRL